MCEHPIDCGPLQVILPNGGETLATGSTASILWRAQTAAVKFDLQYSVDNGESWQAVAKKVKTTSYAWVVPVFRNNKPRAKVRIIAYKSSSARGRTDTSDAPFAIEVLRLDAPNGGEDLTSGTQGTISWTAHSTLRPVAKVKLQYTINGGSTWKSIATFTGNPASYAWTVPAVSSSKSNCKVRVVLQDASGNSLGKDDSNTTFTVHP